jgi:hypothetical protein
VGLAETRWRPGGFIMVLAMMAVSTGPMACKRHGSTKLEGRWHGERADGLAESVMDAGNAFAMGTELVAQGNLVTIHTPASQGEPVSYRVEREDGTTLVIRMEPDGAVETFTFSTQGDVLVWSLDEHRAMTFRRAL